jgi:hypothetical protein
VVDGASSRGEPGPSVRALVVGGGSAPFVVAGGASGGGEPVESAWELALGDISAPFVPVGDAPGAADASAGLSKVGRVA